MVQPCNCRTKATSLSKQIFCLLKPGATHIFPALETHSLVSVGNFCDNGCTATFDAAGVIISKDEQTILTSTRQPNGLW